MKRKLVLICILLIASMLLMNTAVFAFGQPIDTAKSTNNSEMSAIERQISPEITGEERAVIAQVMKTLDPEDRENAVYIAENGKIYANKPELKEVIKWEKVKGNIYRDPEGNVCAFPEEETLGNNATDSDVGILSSGGPYRRIRSITGYTWTSSYFHLAGGADIHESAGDTGYIYTGGIGSTGIEVDAGLQHSPTYDNWSFFLSVNHDPYTTTPRFKSNQNAFVKFYVSSNGYVTLSVSAYDVNNTWRTISYTRAASGFYTSGSGCRIKRCTTIAQTNQNFSSGSWHENAHWYSCKIGTSSTSNHTWLSSDNYQITNYPDSTHVVVNYVSASEETDNIYLNL